MNSLSTYIKEYKNNKSLIDSYLKNNSIEEYKHKNDDSDLKPVGTILGMGIGLFLFFLLLVVGLWIWAIVVLIKYWTKLPTWAKALGVIGLVPGLPGGPVLTLIVVYIGKQG